MVVLLFPLIAAKGWAIDIPIDPRSSFLRLDSADSGALDAVPIELASLGISAGDTIRLQALGDWDFSIFDAAVEGATDLNGLFSSSATLLAPWLPDLNRVPGAIDAGSDVVTGTTLFDGLPTDIAEDFAITDTVIQVPSGATYLFAAVPDSFYGDNADADSNFGLRINAINAVPDGGSTAALLAFGIGGLALSRRKLRGTKCYRVE